MDYGSLKSKYHKWHIHSSRDISAMKKMNSTHKRDGNGAQGGAEWVRLAWEMIFEWRPKWEASASQPKIWRREHIPHREKQQMQTSSRTAKSSRKRNKASAAGVRYLVGTRQGGGFRELGGAKSCWVLRATIGEEGGFSPKHSRNSYGIFKQGSDTICVFRAHSGSDVGTG